MRYDVLFELIALEAKRASGDTIRSEYDLRPQDIRTIIKQTEDLEVVRSGGAKVCVVIIEVFHEMRKPRGWES